MRNRLLLTLICLATPVAFVTHAEEAWACGGFFCNAGTQTPIYQAGERVVFAPSESGGVTMHIEIAYEGEPTDFGWILPIEPPTTADGSIAPIEDILGVSTAELFDQLQNTTDPQFQLTQDFSQMNSCNSRRGSLDSGATTTTGTSFGADTSMAFDAAEGSPPPVAVLSEANVGPYGAQLVQATDADALYEWLNDNGYIQDEMARPLLTHYVGKGFVFLGLKLQSGATSGDIRPVELNLGETYACVPLRLTAIAATVDMPMLVWVLGESRAVPKNFLHARVNPLAIQWPSANNYADTVTDAINSIEGRAFVTEFAGATNTLGVGFWNSELQSAATTIRNAGNALEIVSALEPQGLLNEPEVTDVLRAHIPMPDGLTGYPHGNCYYDPNPWQDVDIYCDSSEDHVTTEAEFYAYLGYWLPELETRGTPLEIDIAALAGELDQTYFAPRERIQAMFDRNPYTTRFYTTVSPSDMTRDPIFAFNPDLADVDRLNVLDAVYRNSPDCKINWVEANYPNGRKVRYECGGNNCGSTFGPVPEQAALLKAEVLDESGEAKVFDPAAADQVDAYLDMAEPGSPSLPVSFVLPEAPEASNETLVVNQSGTSVRVANDDSGCSCKVASTRGSDAPLGLLALGGLLGLGWMVRRRS